MCESCRALSRRRLIGGALAGIAVAPFAPAAPVRASTGLTPDAALAQLLEGNARYRSAPELCELNMAGRRAEVAGGQAPWAMVLSCADSRLPPELIFGGLTLGELFVCRNAGAMADTDVLGSLEYGAEHLGAPLIVVLGHQRCGAVAAACAEAETGAVPPGHIGEMVAAILPAAQAVRGQPGDFTDNAVRENTRRTAARLLSDSAILAERAHSGHLRIVAARYDLDSGAVTLLD